MMAMKTSPKGQGQVERAQGAEGRMGAVVDRQQRLGQPLRETCVSTKAERRPCEVEVLK